MFRIQAFSIAWLMAASAQAAAPRQFSMEEHFAQPLHVSHALASVIAHRLDFRYEDAGCIGTLEDNLEATRINLGPRLSSALLVKPSGMCLCGVHGCYFWVFRQGHRGLELVGEFREGALDITARNKNGVAVLRGETSTARETLTTDYVFNRGRYEEAR